MAGTEDLKKNAAEEALSLIEPGMILGIGTGSTVNYFIEALTKVRNKIEATIASSIQTEKRLRAAGIPLTELNSVKEVPLYVDGCDEFNDFLYLIKGGGGALTREKIVATAAKHFVCIADESKHVSILGKFPVAIEVIPMARSAVARQIVQLGGDPVYRQGFITDNGNVILDVYNLDLTRAMNMEEKLKSIVGVVENGVFAKRSADRVLMATRSGIKSFSKP